MNPKQSKADTPTLKWKWRYETPENYAGPKIKARGKLITDTDKDGDGFVNILGIKGKKMEIKSQASIPPAPLFQEIALTKETT